MQASLFLVLLTAIQCLSWKLTGLDNQVQAQSMLMNTQYASFNQQELFRDNNETSAEVELTSDYEAKQMELVSHVVNRFDEYFRNKKWVEVEHTGLLVRWHSLAYSDILLHEYDSYNELRVSSGIHLNQELCLSQLESLVERLNSMKNNTGTDSNLEQLLDTYGKLGSGKFIGNLMDPGAYFECQKIAIEQSGTTHATRYCIAGTRRPQWPKESLPSLTTKYGVCLPKSCDSANYKNKYHLVNELLQSVPTKEDANRPIITNLYCLPDEDSTLRKWWQNPGSLIFVTLVSSWIGLLLYATVKYEQLRGKQVVDSSGASNPNTKESQQDKRLKTYEMLAITHNLRQLFNTSKSSSISVETSAPGKQIVDLSILEGIKTICMSYVVIGHVLLYFSSVMNNGREMSAVNISNIAFFAANMLPAFAVNSFFTITGLLTAYLMFKSGQTRSLATSARKYSAFVLYRYLRIMPMYILAVAYAKYFAKYTGHGPFWDYGTSSLSPRRHCEQESWLWTLTFTANLKPPLEHCVVSAWYLANDFQFFLLTPILLALLDWRASFGKLVLKCGIMGGYLWGIYNILISDAPDLRPVASFMPHGFKTYVTYLNSSYTYPQFRIPAYLCGLFIGHVLYEYDQSRAKQTTGEQDEQQQKVAEEKRAELPGWLRKHQPSISGLAILSCVCLPLIGSNLDLNKFWARVTVAVCMSSYHIIFSLAIGLYVLAATAGFGNKMLNDFLSAPIWKPFSRLCLCVVLFNVEVVNYFVQSSRRLVYMDFKTQTSFNLLCVTFSYLIAIVICVTFESPIRTGLNKILASVIKQASKSQKQKAQ